MSKQRLLAGISLAGGALFMVALLALPVRAIESAGIGALPANPRPENPRTQSIFVFESLGGKTLEDGIKIINNSDQAKTIRVYGVDSQHSSDGAFACAQEADKQTSVGTWIKLAKNEVTLQPGTNEVVPFTLAIPEGAEPGEHNGCIAVQENTPPRQSALQGIVLSFRSALRVAITVPGDIYADVQFKEVRSEFNQGKLQLSPVLQNDGNVSVDANLSVGLKNVMGMQVAGSGGKFALLRAEESRFNFEQNLPFWGGWYQKFGTIDYVPLRENAADQGARKTAAMQAGWIFVSPHPIALAIEILVPLLLLGATLYWLWRKRQLKLLHMRTKTHIVIAGDNLQTLAAQSGISWRKLAKLNKLQPPYTLAVGQKLKLPMRSTSTAGNIKRHP